MSFISSAFSAVKSFAPTAINAVKDFAKSPEGLQALGDAASNVLGGSGGAQNSQNDTAIKLAEMQRDSIKSQFEHQKKMNEMMIESVKIKDKNNQKDKVSLSDAATQEMEGGDE